MLDPILEQKMDRIAEDIFGTEKDPGQIPITKEYGEILERLTPHWIKYRLDDYGEPIAWSVVVPTQLDLMHKFMRGEITEKELVDLTKHQDEYEALYLCAAVTIPQYRRKGYALETMIEAINNVPHVENAVLFAWAYSEEGRKLVEKLSGVLGDKILVKD